jgi:hypothetical protein
MKGGMEYPSEQGVPMQLTYAQMQKEHQRMALVRMHDHLSRQFPEVCPLNTVSDMGLENRPLRGQQPEHHPVPVPAGIGKSADAEAAPAAAPEVPAEVYKGFKKAKKKLGKKVLAGKMTVDEARAQLGRQFAQKGGGGEVQKSAAVPVMGQTVTVTPGQEPVYSEPSFLPVAYSAPADPEVIKAAVAEATSELKDLLVKQQETFTAKLAEQQRVIDAIADQPDPSTAAFSGLAFQPGVQKARRPAAVPDQAEYAARAQEMVRRNLQHTYTTHSNPHVREAAGEALARLGVPDVAP